MKKKMCENMKKTTSDPMQKQINDQKKNILFICTHNSARSQMAEGLMDHLYGDRYNSFSAGTEPAGVDPNAIQAMSEIGVDISTHRSKSVDNFLEMSPDYVVTVCDNATETCPFFPGGNVRMHRSFRDPSQTQGTSEEILQAFRMSRDEISEWLIVNFG